MNRRIEHRQIELRVRERKIVEPTFDNRETDRIVPRRPQSVAWIGENIDRDGSMTQFSKAIGEPAVACAKIQNVAGGTAAESCA